MIKVLFLDVDGVLNSAETMKKSGGGLLGIDPEIAYMVGRIQADTGCKIVVSSSWRHSPEQLAEIQKRFDTIGITPTSKSGVRGNEIDAWLVTTSHVVEKYAILDDDSDMLVDQAPNFFRTTWEEGLTEEIAKAVTEHLNG